jgi:competence protein ComGF
MSSKPFAYFLMEELLEILEVSSSIHSFLTEVSIRRYTQERKETTEWFCKYGYKREVLKNVFQHRNEFQDMHHLVLSKIMKKNTEIDYIMEMLRQRHVSTGNTFLCGLCGRTVVSPENQIQLCCASCTTQYPL